MPRKPSHITVTDQFCGAGLKVRGHLSEAVLQVRAAITQLRHEGLAGTYETEVLQQTVLHWLNSVGEVYTARLKGEDLTHVGGR